MNISSITNSILKHVRYGERLNPVRDWFVLLILSAIALTGIIIWNMLAFDTIASRGVMGTSVASTTPLFNQASLDTIQNVFADRKSEEEKYENGVYRFADPSQ